MCIAPNGNDVGVPAHFHALIIELVPHGLSVSIGDEERQDASLLQFADGMDGYLVAGSRAQDGGEARHSSVNQLYAQLAENGVGDEAGEPVVSGLAV